MIHRNLNKNNYCDRFIGIVQNISINFIRKKVTL